MLHLFYILVFFSLSKYIIMHFPECDANYSFPYWDAEIRHTESKVYLIFLPAEPACRFGNFNKLACYQSAQQNMPALSYSIPILMTTSMVPVLTHRKGSLSCCLCSHPIQFCHLTVSQGMFPKSKMSASIKLGHSSSIKVRFCFTIAKCHML